MKFLHFQIVNYRNAKSVRISRVHVLYPGQDKKNYYLYNFDDHTRYFKRKIIKIKNDKMISTFSFSIIIFMQQKARTPSDCTLTFLLIEVKKNVEVRSFSTFCSILIDHDIINHIIEASENVVPCRIHFLSVYST